jgi:hypothetical protein
MITSESKFMTAIYGPIFMAGLLTGGLWGWLMATKYHERLMTEEDQEDQEIIKFQELYAAWAILHNIKSTNSGDEFLAKWKPMR